MKEITVFAMFGTLMFCSKKIMEVLPNIHLLGMFIMVFTIVYRKKALVPIYLYVLLDGIFVGFNVWWVPYLYIWAILWAITMLLPRKMPGKVASIVYPVVCGLYGFAFGTLYSPAHALMFGMDMKQLIAWIISGLTFDAMHCLGNFCAGLLVLPLSELLKKIEKL